jgi:FkbM family methyltransferase
MADLRKLIAELNAAPDAGLAKRVAKFCDAAGFTPKVTPFKVLRRARLEVEEVIDVGVFRGTPFLYQAFPDCDFLLVDPRRGAEATLEERPKRYKLFNVALGRAEGEMMLSEQGVCSTLLRWADAERANPQRRYPVKVTTLDALIASELKSSRIGIKIDAEGFEGEVIAGLDAALPRVKFVIVEVSLRRRFEDAPFFSDIVAAMLGKGFSFYNMMESSRLRPQRYLDVLFLPRNDPRLME